MALCDQRLGGLRTDLGALGDPYGFTWVRAFGLASCCEFVSLERHASELLSDVDTGDGGGCGAQLQEEAG
jgi:hypothetical protein